ncbi:GGDEF domain-containing protein [Glycomyces salinus]|uniref:GGDEF domain-containing protein n=1 Tax=Glycomyces salinus TaxID=980294 RepID=UPI0018EB441D|nr:GGDEF domain-containing protein [Glycomyces salinus]
MNPDLITGFATGVTVSGLAVGLMAWTTARGLLRRAETESHTDALTGLPNRKGWEKAAATWTNTTGGPQNHWMILADCNGLKAVNDTYGHQTGDALIQAAADLLREQFPTADIARLGGDEFALLVTWRAWARLRHRRQPLIATVQTARGAVGSRLAVGATRFDGDLSAAMGRADAAMYRNKATGQGPYAVFERDCDDHSIEPRPAVRIRDLDTTPATEAAAREGVG